jgi:outer membrane protein TolC
LSFAISAPGQAKPLTRGAAIELALKQNPQVAAARAVEAQAAARGGQVDAARFPQVTLVGAVGPSLTAHLAPGTEIQSTRSSTELALRDVSVVVGAQLEVLQPLYTFGKISERQRATALELRARKAQTDMTRAEVAYQVAELYESHLFAQDAYNFFDETLHWLSRTIETTEREIDAGTGPTEQDLLRLRTAQGAARLAVNYASAAIAQSRAGLIAYLGLPPGTQLELLERELELLPQNSRQLGALIELARKTRPEFRGLDAGAGAFEALAEAEEADDLPDLFAMGYLSAAYTPGRDWLDSRFVVDPLNHVVPGVLVGARWRFTGPMAGQRGAEQRAKAAELDRLASWAFIAVPAEVNRAFENLERAKKDAAEAAKTTLLAKKWVVSASADYSVGLGDSRDVTEATTAYVQMRLADFDARFRHNVALAELAKVTGTLTDSNCPFYPTREAGAAGTTEKAPGTAVAPTQTKPSEGSNAAPGP